MKKLIILATLLAMFTGCATTTGQSVGKTANEYISSIGLIAGNMLYLGSGWAGVAASGVGSLLGVAVEQGMHDHGVQNPIDENRDGH